MNRSRPPVGSLKVTSYFVPRIRRSLHENLGAHVVGIKPRLHHIGVALRHVSDAIGSWGPQHVVNLLHLFVPLRPPTFVAQRAQTKSPNDFRLLQIDSHAQSCMGWPGIVGPAAPVSRG